MISSLILRIIVIMLTTSVYSINSFISAFIYTDRVPISHHSQERRGGKNCRHCFHAEQNRRRYQRNLGTSIKAFRKSAHYEDKSVKAFRLDEEHTYKDILPPRATASSSTIENVTFSQRETKQEDLHLNVPWLIVGGGIHGVHIAARLLEEGANETCIVDPNPRLLHQWKVRTAQTGMKYLRSSVGYHLDLKEDALRTFPITTDRYSVQEVNALSKQHIGGKKGKRRRKRRDHDASYFTNDYERPRLDLFNQHCDHVIAKYDLDSCHVRGIATEIEPRDNFVKVVVSSPYHGDCADADAEDHNQTTIYHADKVVLALGNDEPSYPNWVRNEDIEEGLVQHLLVEEDNTFAWNVERLGARRIAIIGNGITAAHKAMELLQAKKKNPNLSIHIISRQPWKEQQFDTHQDWMMDEAASKRSELAGGSGRTKRQQSFSDTSCWTERRKIIAQERIPGTVTPAIFRGNNGLSYAIQNGLVHWHQGEVIRKTIDLQDEGGQCDLSTSNASSKCVDLSPRNAPIELSLSCGTRIRVDRIWLATGFGRERPGSTLVSNLVETADLDISDFCSYPIVDQNLSWSSRIFVAGGLAELELGPSARNIAGARLAAERIVKVLRN